jgi:hypothetical protein
MFINIISTPRLGLIAYRRVAVEKREVGPLARGAQSRPQARSLEAFRGAHPALRQLHNTASSLHWSNVRQLNNFFSESL